MIEAARHAVGEAGHHLDPSIPIRRAAWALGEIAARIEPDMTIEAAMTKTRRALAALLNKANHGFRVASGLGAEQADTLAAVAELEAALKGARPNATAIAIGLDW
jgi:hypothetical protein